MSRGLGDVQRAILALIAQRPDEAFTVGDVCRAIYAGAAGAKPTRAQMIAVTRALKTMRLPGAWRAAYAQGDKRLFLYDKRHPETVSERHFSLDEFTVEPRMERVALADLSDVATTTIVLTGGLPDGEV